MNQLCKVCGEPAAGFHFGAFTCEGCKSFFGRTYNNISSISECKNNGECVINKKNRTACKACRLRKCLLVGMSKSGSRYGRRSNWFKIHCLLQEHQQQTGASLAAAASGLLRPHPYLTPLFHRHHAPAAPAPHRSSESDSGASSADMEDDSLPYKPAADTAYFKQLPSSDSECFERRKFGVPSVSPASLPSVSPGGGPHCVGKWPLHGFADPAAWKELWRGAAQAAPPPGQSEPIDLSVRASVMGAAPLTPADSDHELCIDVGVDEPVKSVPLDLTLDREAADVTN